MPYFRYGNPRCPFLRKLGDHPGWELLRAYFRDPDTRTMKAIGWYCQHCHLCWVDGQKELVEAQDPGYGTP